MPTHMFEYIIKTSPSGRHQHHHHHDSHYRSRTRCFDSCAGVPVEKWNGLVEQNHELATSNEALTRENQSLKSDLQTATQENARLSTCNERLTAEVCSLRRSRSTDSETAASFRRRIAALSDEVDSLRKKKGYLATRVDVLSETVSKDARTIGDLTRDIIDWQHQADRLKDMYNKYKRLFLAREKDLEESNRRVEEQRRRLRHLEGPLPFVRGRRYSCA